MSYKRFFLTFFCIAAVSLSSATANDALTNTIVKANQTIAKKGFSATFSKSQLRRVKADPSSVLELFPKGGPRMARYIAQTVTAEPSLVDHILRVSKQATIDQAGAIGAGLARAVRGSLAKLVNDINNSVDQLGSISAQISYYAIGPVQGHAARAIPQPIEIGLADYHGGSFDLHSSTKESVAGSNRNPFQIGLPSHYQLIDNPEALEKLFNTPLEVASAIGSDAEDNGATSTSPTQ